MPTNRQQNPSRESRGHLLAKASQNLCGDVGPVTEATFVRAIADLLHAADRAGHYLYTVAGTAVRDVQYQRDPANADKEVHDG